LSKTIIWYVEIKESTRVNGLTGFFPRNPMPDAFDSGVPPDESTLRVHPQAQLAIGGGFNSRRTLPLFSCFRNLHATTFCLTRIQLDQSNVLRSAADDQEEERRGRRSDAVIE